MENPNAKNQNIFLLKIIGKIKTMIETTIA